MAVVCAEIDHFTEPEAPDMANAAELTTRVEVLEERVGNYVKFVWAVVGVFFVCLCGIGGVLLHLSSDVSYIKGHLEINTATAAIQNAVSAHDSTALSYLKDARVAIKKAKEQSLPINPDLVLRVAEKAINVASKEPSEPAKTEAWQTVQDAVNYASSRIASPRLEATTFSDCLATGTAVAIPDKDRKHATFIPRTVFRNCVLQLDRPDPNNPLISVLLAPATFENCIVRYDGGYPVLVGTLIFRNCLFILDLKGPPVPAGRIFTQTLLASDLTRADTPKS